jgi:hypothetical protein
MPVASAAVGVIGGVILGRRGLKRQTSDQLRALQRSGAEQANVTLEGTGEIKPLE